MRYIVPTYHRPDYMTTPNLLVDRYQIDPHDITICFQDKDDVYSYSDTGVIPRGCEILVNLDAHNAASNRNTGVLAHLGETIVIIDDDIRSFAARNPSLEPDETRDPAPHRGPGIRQNDLNANGFRRMIDDWQSLLESTETTVIALNVSDNSSHMSYTDYPNRFRTNGVLVGQIIMTVASESLLFDEEINCSDDIDFGMRNRELGGTTVRDTSFIVGTVNRIPSRDSEVPGGILEFLPEKERMLQMIADRYPKWLTFKSGWNIPRVRRGVMGYLDVSETAPEVLRPMGEECFAPKRSLKSQVSEEESS